LPVVLLTVAVMLLIFGALGLLGWSFIKKSLLETSQKNAEPQRPQNQAPNVNSQRANADSRSSPTPTRTGTPASIDAAEIRSEIADRIENWRSQSEAIDLDEYMKQYAETVDYYRKPGLSAAFVRADKDRAFSRYDSISIDISNISITPSADGSTATAELDKEWRFEGDGDASSGKVRQMLRFRKIKGQWLITAEKDLRTYETR
jgi:ketosteroid isomerase-like protein